VAINTSATAKAPPADWNPPPAASDITKDRGDHLDLGLAIDILIQQARRARRVPAGT
jgi:hypothetical protein